MRVGAKAIVDRCHMRDGWKRRFGMQPSNEYYLLRGRTDRPETPDRNWAASLASTGSEKSFLCRGVSQGKTSPAHHSEKTYDFSALYICVRNRRVDEFWNAGWRRFGTITGTCRSAGRRLFQNGGYLTRITLRRVVGTQCVVTS